ncbi:MAG: class I fructose-bisphosphate aldolase [Bacteriovoracaceae bacterium]|nr:class I fructose-bisphosphate aldolase [Bacteriovoracaceae bacterium]
MSRLEELLKEKASYLLRHECKTISKDELHLPGKDFVDRIWSISDRTPQVLRSIQTIYNHGRLQGSGYLSILPVDQGVEHSAGSAFATNPQYFDGEKIVQLAIEGGCNAVASTLGVLGSVARKYAHKIPFIVKINHNELLSFPNGYDQTIFANVKQAWDMGAVAIGATIYFGSEQSRRQITEVSEAFSKAHELGMATILWCYTRNSAFKTNARDHHTSADITGQANYLGVTIQADFIKQKMPTHNGGFTDLKYSKSDERMYTKLSSSHPIDITRYQVANCYMGRAGLINSGGEATGINDFPEAITSAIINKRAGGTGLILGRKAFQRPLKEGILLLNDIQDIYLDKNITIA